MTVEEDTKLGEKLSGKYLAWKRLAGKALVGKKIGKNIGGEK